MQFLKQLWQNVQTVWKGNKSIWSYFLESYRSPTEKPSDPCSPRISSIMICCHREYEQYTRFLWYCFSTGVFSPYHVECLLWNDPQKMWNVWAVRNGGVGQCAESCWSQWEPVGQKGRTLSILFLCEAQSDILTHLKQVCRSDGRNQSQTFCLICVYATLNKSYMVLFNIFVPNCRKKTLFLYLFRGPDIVWVVCSVACVFADENVFVLCLGPALAKSPQGKHQVG